jgi:hypothetical protein
VLSVSVVLLVAYGYEIFSFSLTMDEPVFGELGQRALLNTWSAGGRWGMGLVSAVMPPMVVPGLSSALGVLLTASGVWLLARRVHSLAAWPSAALTALCVSLPMILLHLSFMTNAVGIGIGFVLSAVVAERVDSARRPVDVLAVVLATFVLGVYEAFGFVLLAVALGMLVRRPCPGLARTWAALLTLAFILSEGVGLAIRAVLGVGASDYSSSMLDLPGLLGDPWGRMVSGATRAYGVVRPGGPVFDRGMPWLAVIGVGLVLLAVARVATHSGPRGEVLIRWVALVGLLAVPLAAGAVVVDLPLRSMLYLPAVVVSLTAVVLTAPGVSAVPLRSWGAAAVISVGAMAVASNISVDNRALGSAEVALAHDRFVAMRIDEERQRLTRPALRAVPAYVTPVLRWPESSVTPGLEHLGLSLFSGETWRASAFLRSQGVPVANPTPAQERTARMLAGRMPVYPEPGWVRVDAGVLIVRLR